MSYTVLARRYRSRSFDELVGQEHVAKTLQAAIEADRVAHAYLFTGTRGVGKTSAARLFAAALNAPGGEPKDVAEAIMAGRDTDVIEIDAASNNKVDDARELIANAVYRPLRGGRKIYIIDEVHMLTTQAFNALLKTMEEPPDHVVFILCTTEAHKVLATIQSRCQRFDFRSIPTSRIGEHLARVVKDEGLKAEPELLHMVARLGNGSMRDALSLLDRLMACGEPTLTTKLLETLLGIPDRDVLSAIVEAISEADAGSTLTQADTLLKRGVSPEQFLDSLADAFRDLLIILSVGPDSDLVELADTARTRAAEQAQHFTQATLVHLIALCDASARNIKNSSNSRAVLDATLVRMAMTRELADVAAAARGAPAITNGSASPKKQIGAGPRTR